MVQREKMLIFGFIFMMFIVTNEAQRRTLKIYDFQIDKGVTHRPMCEHGVYSPDLSSFSPFHRIGNKILIFNLVSWTTYHSAVRAANNARIQNFRTFLQAHKPNVQVYMMTFSGFESVHEDFRPYAKQAFQVHQDLQNISPELYYEIIDDALDDANPMTFQNAYSPFLRLRDNDIRDELKKLKGLPVPPRTDPYALRIEYPHHTKLIMISDPYAPEETHQNVYPLVVDRQRKLYLPTDKHYFNYLTSNMIIGLYITDGHSFINILGNGPLKTSFEQMADYLGDNLNVHALMCGVFNFDKEDYEYLGSMIKEHWLQGPGMNIQQHVYIYGDGICDTTYRLPNGLVLSHATYFHQFREFQARYRAVRPPKTVRFFAPTQSNVLLNGPVFIPIQTVNGIYEPVVNFQYSSLLRERKKIQMLILDNEVCDNILLEWIYPNFVKVINILESPEHNIIVMSCDNFEDFDVHHAGDILAAHGPNPLTDVVTMGDEKFNVLHKHRNIPFHFIQKEDLLESFLTMLPIKQIRRSG